MTIKPHKCGRCGKQPHQVVFKLKSSGKPYSCCEICLPIKNARSKVRYDKNKHDPAFLANLCTNRQRIRNAISTPHKCRRCSKQIDQVVFKLNPSGKLYSSCETCRPIVNEQTNVRYNVKKHDPIYRTKRNILSKRLRKTHQTRDPVGHKEREKIYALRAYQKNKTRIKERSRLYMQNIKNNHPEKYAAILATNRERSAKHRHLLRTDPTTKIGFIMKNAMSRGIYFDIDAIEEMKNLLSERCYYTGMKFDELNGLDRKDPTGGYFLWNVVPCLPSVNVAKGIMQHDEFIDHTRIMYANLPKDFEPLPLSRLHPVFCRDNSEEKRKKFKDTTLSKDVRIQYWTKPCYICLGGPSSGIDRLDSNVGYIEENCNPCCTRCNLFKHIMTLEETRSMIYHIYHYTVDFEIDNSYFDQTVSTLFRHERNPVALVDINEEYIAVFPSGKCANKMLGDNYNVQVDKTVVDRRKFKLIPIAPSEYLTHFRANNKSCTEIVMHLRKIETQIDNIIE